MTETTMKKNREINKSSISHPKSWEAPGGSSHRKRQVHRFAFATEDK